MAVAPGIGFGEHGDEYLRLAMVEPDPDDHKDVIVEIRPGAGGDEAAIWAGDLTNMYLRYAQQHGLRVELISTTDGDAGGFKEAFFSVAGDEAFSEAKLAALRADKRGVFVYFTADWCLTCKVNEKAAIETATVRDAFAKNKVAVLIGDWTDGDPVMGRFIQARNRAGVPLYLYYAPGAAEPTVLPQVLTPGLLEGLGA